jgi:hypothetical protein
VSAALVPAEPANRQANGNVIDRHPIQRDVDKLAAQPRYLARTRPA